VLDLDLLHRLRLLGMTPDPGGPSSDVLVTRGFAVRRGERIILTPAGREHAEDAARLDPGSDAETATRRVYEGFLPLNAEILRACSDWQVRPGGITNDHADAAYDWAVIDRIVAIDERIGVPVTRLGRSVGRFSHYRPRLRDALTRVEDGEHEWLVSPRLDSYHTVWMQLHEDLLLALGIARGEEPAP
jgi:hypothetical protein